MASTGVNTIGSQSSAQSTNHDAYKSLDLNTFMKLLVTEMSNQDPLDPMNNQEILQQISQIRSIEASDRLTTTLDSVLLGQNVATAGSMLGRTITGLDDGGAEVSGRVDRVSIAGGEAKLYVGDRAVSLNNVSGILPDSSGQ
jgi:flagellar basal-body rod modification protein FlgD